MGLVADSDEATHEIVKFHSSAETGNSHSTGTGHGGGQCSDRDAHVQGLWETDAGDGGFP
jgi:hypothetical protein